MRTAPLKALRLLAAAQSPNDPIAAAIYEAVKDGKTNGAEMRAAIEAVAAEVKVEQKQARVHVEVFTDEHGLRMRGASNTEDDAWLQAGLGYVRERLIEAHGVNIALTAIEVVARHDLAQDKAVSIVSAAVAGASSNDEVNQKIAAAVAAEK